MEQLCQAAARVPDQGGGVPHHFLHRPVSKHLDAVELHIAGREQVPVRDDRPVPFFGLGHARPSGQRPAALGQAASHLVERPSVDQGSTEGGGGGKGSGQTPEQVSRLAQSVGGQQGEQHAGEQQQRTDHPVDPLGPIVHLDLAAEAAGNSGPLAVGIPAIPLSLVQGKNVRF